MKQYVAQSSINAMGRFNEGNIMISRQGNVIIRACLMLCALTEICHADQRCYVFSGYEWGQALFYVGQETQNAERNRVIYLRSTDTNENVPIYRSTTTSPSCFVDGCDNILVSDYDADGSCALTVIDHHGDARSRLKIGSKGCDIRTAGWLAGGSKYYYSEEYFGEDQYIGGCPMSKGIYTYDMASKTTALVSSTERRIAVVPTLGGILLSNDCFDPPKDTILLKQSTGERIPHAINGLHVSLEGDYYFAEPSEGNEGYVGIYKTADNTLCAHATQLCALVRAEKWLAGNRLLLVPRSFIRPLQEKDKYTYLYDMKKALLQRIPGRVLAQGRDSRYVLIVNLDGNLQEVDLDKLTTIRVEDLLRTSPKKPETAEGVSTEVPNVDKQAEKQVQTPVVGGDVPSTEKPEEESVQTPK